MTDDEVSAAYLKRARERISRARKRQTAWFMLVLGPYALGIVALRALAAHEYPPGDYRNQPLFWAASAVAALVFWGSLMALAIRRLRDRDADTTNIEEPPRDIPEH